MKKKLLTIDIEELLIERNTTHQLTSNTNVFFGQDRKQDANTVQLQKVQYVPSVEQGILVVKAETRTDDKTYETTIQFANVRYMGPGKDDPYAVSLPLGDGEIKVMPLKLSQNYVEVHCECMDFYWRFAMHNAKNQSLLGEPPKPYVKKTDRKPNNPSRVPGSCKHLMKLVDQLKAEKLLK